MNPFKIKNKGFTVYAWEWLSINWMLVTKKSMEKASNSNISTTTQKWIHKTNTSYPSNWRSQNQCVALPETAQNYDEYKKQKNIYFYKQTVNGKFQPSLLPTNQRARQAPTTIVLQLLCWIFGTCSLILVELEHKE